MTYIPLNIKTNYHLLSSLVDINDLISMSKKNNIKALGITDPKMYGVMDFYKECKKNDIKPIIGLELNVDNYPFYLYAINYEGYQNLTRLNFIKQEEPITFEILVKYSDNILCIVPFISSNYFNDFKKIYKYLYLSYTNTEERKYLINLTNKVIFVNEVLQLKNDSIYLKYLYMIRDGKKQESIKDYSLNEYSYLLTNEEVSILMHKEDFKNMEDIYNLCNIEFKYNLDLLPKYNDDPSFLAHEYLKALCKKGLMKRFDNKVSNVYIERLKYELEVINKMGFDNYFLVVWDFIKYAKNKHILVGPGRGSAAGSLASYVLGITDIDPIKYSLFFERFLNPERITMPDIDIDFESIRRDEVVEYLINKYGPKRAMPIITFVNLGGRQVIRDVGRILDIDQNKLDEMCKLMDPKESLKSNIESNNRLKGLIENNKNYKYLYKIALNLENSKRQISVHAAGIVISSLELDNYIPMQKYDSYYLTGYSMGHLEELGLLKIDLLSLANLTLIETVLSKIEKINPNFKLNEIDLNDKETLLLFEKGHTEGVFQFETNGMKNFIKKLKPSSFEELIAVTALFRPGPIDNIDSYIKRKYGQEKIDYFHPDLMDILKPTYGIIVYQEQIMQIASIMAGYSLGEADVLRRAMSKKKKEVLVDEETKFVSQSINKGYDKETASKVYNLILKFANFGFNRAHSVPYALIGYRMAYLKVHYANIFMSTLLTNVIGNDSKTKYYIDECKEAGVNILRPDINVSEYDYKEDQLGIRFSLAAIKNIGSITCKEIIKAREVSPFDDFTSFVIRTYGKTVNKKAIETLIDAGCFDIFGYNHQTLHHNLQMIINYADLVRNLDESLVERPVMEIIDEFDKEELSQRELSAFGFYLDNHPTMKYIGNYKDAIKAGDIKEYFDKVIEIVIIIDKLKEVTTKKEEIMLFITGSDDTSNIDVVLFPAVYINYSNLKKGQIILVKGRIEKRMSRYQLVAREVEILS